MFEVLNKFSTAPEPTIATIEATIIFITGNAYNDNTTSDPTSIVFIGEAFLVILLPI
jgi:hypothetical protein